MQPDGMGADRYNERQNMKEARHASGPGYTHELAAMDDDGNELYRTEGFHSFEDARDAAAEANSSTLGSDRLDDDVARFKPVEKED